MAITNRIQPVHPAYASKGDILQAGKAIHDKLRSDLERRLSEAEHKLQAAQDEVRQFVGRVVREGLEGQGKAFKDFMMQELLSIRNWCQDSLLRHEAKALALRDHTVSSLDRLHEEFQKGQNPEEVSRQISQRFDEELASRAEDIQRRCEESVRGIYEKNAASMQQTYHDNLGYIKSMDAEVKGRLEDGLDKGLSRLESACSERLSSAGKALEEQAVQVKVLEEHFQKRFEEELAIAVGRLEARFAEKADFLQRSHQEALGLVSSLLEGLNLPAPVVRNEIQLPEALPAEVVVNVPSLPPEKLKEKIISYDDLGRPWKTTEREVK